MANAFSTTVTDWQGVDDEPTEGSENLVKSGGVKAELNRIDDSLQSLTREGAVVTHNFAEAFTIAGLVLSNGNWDRAHYQSAYHTDYIDMHGYSKIKAYGLWGNFYGVTLYDKDKQFVSNIEGVQQATVISSDYPLARYAVFQAESNQQVAYYKTYSEDGDVTVLKKDVSFLLRGDTNITKKIVLNGDSLCNHLGLQLMNIAHSQGYELLNRTRGGESIIGNLTRAGGLLARVKQEFVMPASGSVNIALNSAWVYSNGAYAETPYNWTPTEGQKFWIKNIKGTLFKLKMVAVIAYDSSHTKLDTFVDRGNYTMPSGTAFIRVNINAVSTSGEPHVSINNVPLDIETLCNIQGYVDENDNVVQDSDYLHSDYIAVSSNNLYFDGCATPDAYTFTREESGASFKVGVGTDCFDNRLITDKNYPHIWFSGQNGGYETPLEYAQMTAAAANAFNDRNLVVTTHTSNCTTAIVEAATKEFGVKYFNIRAYMAGNAIYDGLRYGLITDTSLVPSDWEDVFLDAKKVHEDAEGAYLEAVQIWNKMVMLGMVEGTMIDSNEFYVTNAESKLGYWYYVPEEGYGENFPIL